MARSKLQRQISDNVILDDKEDEMRMEAVRSQPRRAGICTEGFEANLQDFVKPVFPKSPDSQAVIRNLIASNDKLQVLLGHVDSDTLSDIVNAFEEIVADEGTDIIKQGEEGDCLYLLAEGQVDVFVARPGDGAGERGARACSLGSGALFGELALMYSAPRAATVCISSPKCKLWKLEREPFRRLLAHNGRLQYEMYRGWLSMVDLLATLNNFELSRLSEMMDSELFDADEVIIQQGDPGDRFYILEDGTCAAFIAGPEGEIQVKEYSTQGEYFGEIALLNNEPRRATVRATGSGCSVISVSQEDFNAVLGPIQERLKEDIGRYPHYAEFLK